MSTKDVEEELDWFAVKYGTPDLESWRSAPMKYVPLVFIAALIRILRYKEVL
jgi:hypothetical protein